MNRKPTTPPIKTWQFYSAAIHFLDKSFLASLYKRSPRQIERWAADPDTTESHQRNPMDRYEAVLKRLIVFGAADIARSAVNRQAAVVGCHLVEAGKAASPADKHSMAEGQTLEFSF